MISPPKQHMVSGSETICPRCKNVLPAGSEFCDQCGASLAKTSGDGADKEWIVGSAPDCDIFVDRATVSRRHCALRLRKGDYFLEDLKSANRTYVNDQAISAEIPISKKDHVTLGRKIDFSPYWPSEQKRQHRATTIHTKKVLSIGRGPQNDIRLNRPHISLKHAELSNEKGVWTLSDAGSEHGTAVNDPANRIRTAQVKLDDIAFFGGYRVSIKDLLNGTAGKLLEEFRLPKARTTVGRAPDCDVVLDHPSVSSHHAELVREGHRTYVRDLGSLNGTFVSGELVAGLVEVQPNGVVGVGVFTLVITPEGTLEKAEPFGDFVLSAEGLSIEARRNEKWWLRRSPHHRKQLLEAISFTFFPQEMIALMGGSGAGKTTLLKALCGYTRPATGQILYNGRDLYANYGQFRHLIGYVPQDDIMHGELKVQEALLFSVMLRTGQKKADAMKDVERVLRDLQLWDIRHEMIGSPMDKVISGGQRKRVNIAMELLCQPSCLFLDEPTSGLSSGDAEMVVGVLRALAQRGKTVVMTIHQPSREIFRMFGALAMLKRDRPQNDQWAPGRRVYFGPAWPDSLEFFNPQRVKELRARGEEPGPELLFQKLDDDEEGAEVWEKRYLRSDVKEKYIDDRRDQPLKVNPVSPAPKRRFLAQALLLVRRNALIKMRDRMQRIFITLQPVLFGALIVLMFRGLRNPDFSDATKYHNFLHSLETINFLIAIAAVWFGCNNAVREIVGELPIYIREHMACLSIGNYVLAKYLFQAGLCFLQCLALLAIVYFGCGLQGPFWLYVGTTWVTAMVGVSIGLSISALAALFKTPEAAVAALPLVLLPMIMFGGGIYPLYLMEEKTQIKVPGIEEKVPISRVLSDLAPTRWLFEMNLVAEAAERKGSKVVPPKSELCVLAKQDSKTGLMIQTCLDIEEKERREDLASELFPRDKGPGRAGLGACFAWLGGLFAAGLAMVFVLLRRLGEKEVG